MEGINIMSRILENMSFFTGVSVIATTVICLLLYREYISKTPPLEGQPYETLSYPWALAFFMEELAAQSLVANYMSAWEAVLNTIINVVFNIILFFVCYGGLCAVGVSKENNHDRINKSFKGVVIISWILIFLL